MKQVKKLLSREDFREQVLARFSGRCAFCDAVAVDAHHIMERRLFPDGGYYLHNGAPVCHRHHIECEQTLISVEQVRERCGYDTIVLPEHLYADQRYDKWGNIIVNAHERLPGELFDDPSVQKILESAGMLELFKRWVKYPRTYHLPWSLGVTSDDRMHSDMSHFVDKRVIVTQKMDGENTTLYTDYLHARSVDSKSHPSRAWVKAFWSARCASIPQGWRVCGENLYAKHSIEYDNLESYFLGFSVWDEHQWCMDWDSTCQWMELLEIPKVPVLYDGVYDEKKIKSLWTSSQWKSHEGYVIRTAEGFYQRDFKKWVGKFVRNEHVQTDAHWMQGKKVQPNGIANGVNVNKWLQYGS